MSALPKRCAKTTAPEREANSGEKAKKRKKSAGTAPPSDPPEAWVVAQPTTQSERKEAYGDNSFEKSPDGRRYRLCIATNTNGESESIGPRLHHRRRRVVGRAESTPPLRFGESSRTGPAQSLRSSQRCSGGGTKSLNHSGATSPLPSVITWSANWRPATLAGMENPQPCLPLKMTIMGRRSPSGS